MSELTDQERQARLKALNALMDLMRPSVQADGGDLVLVRVDVETGVVEVQFTGLLFELRDFVIHPGGRGHANFDRSPRLGNAGHWRSG